LKLELDIINKYYVENIIPMIKIYNDSSNVYDKKKEKNKTLVVIVDIITHVVKYVISSNFYLMVRKQVYTTIVSQDIDTFTTVTSEEKMKDYLNYVVDKVLNNEYQGKDSIHNYIMGSMTEQIVKKILQVYARDDTDSDIAIRSLLEHVCTILTHNYIKPLVSESLLIKTMKEYLITYYSEIYISLIPMMKQVLDNYIGYLYNDGQNISVLCTLAEFIK
jgi:hypothetical protein